MTGTNARHKENHVKIAIAAMLNKLWKFIKNQRLNQPGPFWFKPGVDNEAADQKKQDTDKEVNQTISKTDLDLESNFPSNDKCFANVTSKDHSIAKEHFSVLIKIGKTKITLLLDPDSVCTVVNDVLTNAIVANN